jgi:hypothetical protein
MYYYFETQIVEHCRLFQANEIGWKNRFKLLNNNEKEMVFKLMKPSFRIKVSSLRTFSKGSRRLTDFR